MSYKNYEAALLTNAKYYGFSPEDIAGFIDSMHVRLEPQTMCMANVRNVLTYFVLFRYVPASFVYMHLYN